MPRTTKKTTAPVEKHTIPTVPAAEQPYKVPENWRWVRLGEIYVINPHVEGDDSMDVSFVPMEKVNPGMCSDFTFDILPWKQAKKGHTRFANGDIAFAKISPCFENRKAFIATGLLNGIGGGTTELIILRHPKILQKYTYYSIMADRFINGGVQTYSGTVGQQRISMDYVRNYPFPLPPLAEQQRIVDRIESLFAKLDEAREKAQAVVDGFENRKAAILHKAFTGELTKKWREDNYFDSRHFLEQIQLKLSKQKKHKLVQNDFLDNHKNTIPSNWIFTNLNSIAKLITDGEHKTPNRVDEYSGYYLLSARNVINDGVKLDDVDYIDENEYNTISRRCNPKCGDILISCSGSVGRCCVVQDNNKYCMVRSAAMISQDYCNARFIMYMIQSDEVQEQIQQLSKQTAQANLFLGAIASLYIPLPTKEEQDLIVNIVDSLFSQERRARDLAESVIVQIDGMKKAILARAFRGELGTNDPSEAACEV